MSGLLEIEKIEAIQNEDPEDDDPYIQTNKLNNQDERDFTKPLDDFKNEKITPDEVICEEEGIEVVAKKHKKYQKKKRRGIHVQLKNKDRRVEYPCAKCKLVFHHVRLYKDHLMSHQPDLEMQDYICPHPNCARTFLSQGGLKNHLNFHSSTDLLHHCPFCNTNFQTQAELENHQIEFHSKEISQQKVSEIIGRSYSSRLESFKRNARRKRTYKCEKCLILFGNIIVYKKHVRTHDNPKNHDIKAVTTLNTLHLCKSSQKYNAKSINPDQSSTRNEKPLENEDNPEISNHNVKCSLCLSNFPDSLKHDVHLVRIHRMPAKCSKCNKTFPTVHRLFRHHSVHNHPVFKCRQSNCEASFRTQNSLTVHEKRHQGVFPYDCSYCEKSFQTRAEYVQHKTDVHNENVAKQLRRRRHKVLNCVEEDEKCEYNKTSKINEGSYPCLRSNCNVVFKWPKSLEIHERKHQGLLPYVCPICNESFSMKQECCQHRVDVHKSKLGIGLIPSNVQCEFCGAVFKKSYTLIRHVTREHSNEKHFVCGVCDKRFAVKYDYLIHMKYHTGKFVCEICGKVYHSNGDLIRHTKIHTADSNKPFKCDICCKGFIRHDHFMEHSRIHTGEKPHHCDMCGNSYRSSSSLSSHKERSHRNEGGNKVVSQTVCFECTKCFSNQNYLKAHLKRVHGKDINGISIVKPKPKMYPCDLCDKQFHKRIRLIAHRAKHGGIGSVPQRNGSLYDNKDGKVYEKKKNQHRNYEIQDATSNGGEIMAVDLTNPLLTVSISPDYSVASNESSFPVQLISLNNFSHLSNAIDHSKHVYTVRENNSTQINNSGESGRNSEYIVGVCSEVALLEASNTPIMNNNCSTLLTDIVIPNDENVNLPDTEKRNVAFLGDDNFEDEFESPIELNDSNLKTEATNKIDLVTVNTNAIIITELEPNTQDMNQAIPDFNKTENVPQLNQEQLSLRKLIEGRVVSLQLSRIPTYTCKPCNIQFHLKTLYEKHCRTYRHWKILRSIKQIEQSSPTEAENVNNSSQGSCKMIGRYCPICDEPSPTLKELTSHCRSEHPGQKPFSCELCGSSYFNYKHLKHHQSVTHKKPEEYICMHCEEKYTCYDLFRKHVATHKNQERKCYLCNDKFTVLKLLIRHCELTHPGEKPFVCDICGTGYSQYKMFRIHRTRFHTSAELHADDPSKIRKPGRGREKLHGEAGRSMCDICGKEVLHMKVHMETHETQGRHLCDVCGLGFKRRSNMVNHKRRHVGERKFHCSMCDKTFYFMRDVRLHEQTHNKNFGCTTCAQRFSSEELLQKHLGLHDNTRPYRCDTCGFMFNFRSNLMIHISKIHCKTRP